MEKKKIVGVYLKTYTKNYVRSTSSVQYYYLHFCDEQQAKNLLPQLQEACKKQNGYWVVRYWKAGYLVILPSNSTIIYAEDETGYSPVWRIEWTGKKEVDNVTYVCKVVNCDRIHRFVRGD